jgi:hypothetical protein
LEKKTKSPGVPFISVYTWQIFQFPFLNPIEDIVYDFLTGIRKILLQFFEGIMGVEEHPHHGSMPFKTDTLGWLTSTLNFFQYKVSMAEKVQLTL